MDNEILKAIIVLTPLIFGAFLIQDLHAECNLTTYTRITGNTTYRENIGFIEFRSRSDGLYRVGKFNPIYYNEYQYQNVSCYQNFSKATFNKNRAYLEDNTKEYLKTLI